MSSEPDKIRRMLRHAEAYIASSEANLASDVDQYAVAYDEARHAAEVAGKALLERHGLHVGNNHPLGGLLSREGLIPVPIDRREISKLLSHHTRARYGYYEEGEEFGHVEVRKAIDMATILLGAARDPATMRYHPPPDGGPLA